MKYRVPVVTLTTEVYIVEAESKEEAMNLAIVNWDSGYANPVEIIEGDPEVYYPDITEEKS